MAWLEIDDEQGVSDIRIIAKDAEAAIRLDAIDLTIYSPHGTSSRHRLYLSDGLKIVWGYIGEADDVDDGRIEKVIDGDCSSDSFTKQTFWYYDGANEEYDKAVSAIAKYIYQLSRLDLLRCYRVSYQIKNYVNGYAFPLAGTGGIGHASVADGSYVEYLTCMGDTTLLIGASAAGNLSVDNISFGEVQHLGTDAVHIYSDRGLKVQSWNGDTATIDWNSIILLEIYEETGIPMMRSLSLGLSIDRRV